jgi:hypothetical protein
MVFNIKSEIKIKFPAGIQLDFSNSPLDFEELRGKKKIH